MSRRVFTARIEARHQQARIVLLPRHAVYEHLVIEGQMPSFAPTAPTVRALGAVAGRASAWAKEYVSKHLFSREEFERYKRSHHLRRIPPMTIVG